MLTVLAHYLHANVADRTEQGRTLSSSDLVLHDLWPLAGARNIRSLDALAATWRPRSSQEPCSARRPGWSTGSSPIP
ncbi:hypothetical protein [Streptomyces sp. WAC08241]|uniref:hypothetical protein n=1 Tax=Streptomyces sp. WAC08241 TaxID=2487421 RepID=UPI000F79FA8C|nr:hypothetical protein [Streptomyces sp. WAC08241]RSS42591.1 hypothetical protein EF906_11800 [Streptomyces sp. WAC08241]